MGRNLLVVGGGGREHALAWRLQQDAPDAVIHVAPGNGGTVAPLVNHAVAADDVPGIVSLCRQLRPELVVIGPEASLAAGMVDALEAAGFAAFGPSAAAARLESSKTFAKEVMDARGIPTARWWPIHGERDLEAAAAAGARVVKADGLAAGKGVVVCRDEADTVAQGRQLLNVLGGPLVAEERSPGVEVSVIALCDGNDTRMLPSVQDHKRLLAGDLGPNTGGMGTVSPGTAHNRLGMDEATLLETVRTRVVLPVLEEMRARGAPFRGALFAGLMVDPSTRAFHVLEFNARFGDPETQVLVTRLTGSLLGALLGCARGALAGVELGVDAGASVCVVMAADGYPGTPRTRDPIAGLDQAGAMPAVRVFHAGTRRADDGSILTAGGRVLGVTATGDTTFHALDRAYGAAALIRWPGATLRRDIGRPTPA